MRTRSNAIQYNEPLSVACFECLTEFTPEKNSNWCENKSNSNYGFKCNACIEIANKKSEERMRVIRSEVSTCVTCKTQFCPHAEGGGGITYIGKASDGTVQYQCSRCTYNHWFKFGVKAYLAISGGFIFTYSCGIKMMTGIPLLTLIKGMSTTHGVISVFILLSYI